MQQPFAAFLQIPPSCIEIIRVPWISHFAGAVGEIHQEVHFVGKISPTDSIHIPQIGAIHSDRQIVFLIVAVLKLAGSLARAVDPMLGQLAAGR